MTRFPDGSTFPPPPGGIMSPPGSFPLPPPAMPPPESPPCTSCRSIALSVSELTDKVNHISGRLNTCLEESASSKAKIAEISNLCAALKMRCDDYDQRFQLLASVHTKVNTLTIASNQCQATLGTAVIATQSTGSSITKLEATLVHVQRDLLEMKTNKQREDNDAAARGSAAGAEVPEPKRRRVRDSPPRYRDSPPRPRAEAATPLVVYAGMQSPPMQYHQYGNPRMPSMHAPLRGPLQPLHAFHHMGGRM